MRASAMCPMRTFAMTGIETASWLDAANHGGVTHAAHAAGRADVCGDALECHDGASARVFRDARLLGRGDIHDDAALEHLGEILVEFVTGSLHGKRPRLPRCAPARAW